MLVRRIARPLLASIFITGGLDEILNPANKQDVAESVVTPLFGKSVNTATVIQVDGAVKVAAGTALALGRFPRISALALASSLVPTTLAAHRFWELEDPQQRQAQQVQFVKNVSLLGGLLLASVDTEGKPSVGWRARRAARKFGDQISGTPAPTLAIGETASNVVGSLEAAAGRAREAFPSEAVGSAAVQVVDSLGSASERAREAFPSETVGAAAHTLVDRVEAASSRADRRALKKAAKSARKQLRSAADTSVASVEDVAGRAKDAFPKDSVDDALSLVSGKFDAVSDTVADTFDTVTHKFDDALSRRDRRRAKKRAKKAAKQFRQDVQAAAHSARENLELAADSARSSVGHAADGVRSRASF